MLLCRWAHPLIWAVVAVFILWGGFMQIIGWMEQVTHEGEPLVDFLRDVRPPVNATPAL